MKTNVSAVLPWTPRATEKVCRCSRGLEGCAEIHRRRYTACQGKPDGSGHAGQHGKPRDPSVNRREAQGNEKGQNWHLVERPAGRECSGRISARSCMRSGLPSLANPCLDNWARTGRRGTFRRCRVFDSSAKRFRILRCIYLCDVDPAIWLSKRKVQQESLRDCNRARLRRRFGGVSGMDAMRMQD